MSAVITDPFEGYEIESWGAFLLGFKRKTIGKICDYCACLCECLVRS